MRLPPPILSMLKVPVGHSFDPGLVIFSGVVIPAGLVFQEGKFGITQIGRDAPVKEVDVGGSLACMPCALSSSYSCSSMVQLPDRQPSGFFSLVLSSVFSLALSSVFSLAFSSFFFLGAFVFFFLGASSGSSNSPATHALHRGSANFASGMPLKDFPH